MDTEQKLIELLKLSQDSLNTRRDIELKYYFGLWASIGAVHLYLAEHISEISASLIIYYCAMFILFTAITLKFWYSNERDHYFIMGYKKVLDLNLPEEPGNCLYHTFKGCWIKHINIWHILYILFTGCLLYASFDLLSKQLNIVKLNHCCHSIAPLPANNVPSDSSTCCVLIIYVVVFLLSIIFFCCLGSKFDKWRCNIKRWGMPKIITNAVKEQIKCSK